jgi:hypothetical protein
MRSPFAYTAAPILAAALVLLGGPAHAWETIRPATSFDRSALVRPDDLEKVRNAGRLGGRGPEDWGITGWFEYDFAVPADGWYELFVRDGGGDLEYRVDPGPDEAAAAAFYGISGSTADESKVGNVWLGAGRHTVRLQKYYWTGFWRVASVGLRSAGPALAKSVRAWLPGGFGDRQFRRDACPALEVEVGGTGAPGELWVHYRDAGGASRRVVPVPVPADRKPVRRALPLYCDEAGAFTAALSDGPTEFPAPDRRTIEYEVVDTASAGTGFAVARTLAGGADAADGPARTPVDEIDLADVPPEYADPGGTRVANSALGAYRESGATGFTTYQRSPGYATLPQPSWFAYRLAGLVPQAPHLVEIDYPDDARRSFVIALRESAPLEGPVAGGVDSGGEFTPSGRMQTHRLVFWPRSADARAVFMNTHDGARAAAARIRVYRLEYGLPPFVPAVDGGRHFQSWYEEGASFLSIFGAPAQYPAAAGIGAAVDRWADAVAHLGGTVLAPTAVVYSFALYPSRFNRAFSLPDVDVIRRIMLAAERRGLKVLPEVYPRADELAWPFAAAPDPKPNLLVSKEGRTNHYAADGTTRNVPPFYNPLHPVNEAWLVGMIGEAADRYRDSPALLGVNLRQGRWFNPALYNFHSLDWGYDDYTVQRFAAETGVAVPGPLPSPGGTITPAIARARHDFLTSPEMRARWIDWRCRKIAELYARIRDRVRAARSDLKLYSTVFRWAPDGTPEALREAGIDPALLGAVDGVVLIDASHAYGRREPDALSNQRQRDSLLRPTRHLPLYGRTPAFLTYSHYIEATELVVRPESLGFDPATKLTWVSAPAEPAGAHALERFAVVLAETDAHWLGDGGNGYLLGQPALREFLREYRAIPAERFGPRADARDPVAVWTLARADGLWFYAVNRERHPATVALRLANAVEVDRPATGVRLPVANGRLELALAPYELAVFRAAPGAVLETASARLPPSAVSRVHTQAAFVAALAREAREGKLPIPLDPGEIARLDAAVKDAQEALAARHYWRARTLLEHTDLIAIYERLKRYPPELRDDPAAGG